MLFCRESIYRLLPQTTTGNIAKNFDQYTIDPGTRYPNLNSSCVRPHQVRGSAHLARSRNLSTGRAFILMVIFSFLLQVRHLYISAELNTCSLERSSTIRRPVNLSRRGTFHRNWQIPVFVCGCMLSFLCPGDVVDVDFGFSVHLILVNTISEEHLRNYFQKG